MDLNNLPEYILHQFIEVVIGLLFTGIAIILLWIYRQPLFSHIRRVLNSKVKTANYTSDSYYGISLTNWVPGDDPTDVPDSLDSLVWALKRGGAPVSKNGNLRRHISISTPQESSIRINRVVIHYRRISVQGGRVFESPGGLGGGAPRYGYYQVAVGADKRTQGSVIANRFTSLQDDAVQIDEDREGPFGADGVKEVGILIQILALSPGLYYWSAEIAATIDGTPARIVIDKGNYCNQHFDNVFYYSFDAQWFTKDIVESNVDATWSPQQNNMN